MSFLNFKDIASVSLILFSVIDILGAIPLIMDIKKRSGHIESGKASLVAAIIMLVFLYLGEKVLKLFGVDIQSFALAGAIIILILGMEMILGRRFFKDTSSDGTSGSIVPLAFPVIAGAGTMTTLVSLRSQYAIENIIVGVVLNILLVYIVLRSAGWLERKLGDNGVKVLGKIFGIVLLAISIKIITAQLANVKTTLQGTVEKIEKTVTHIEQMHQENLILMQQIDSMVSKQDTVVIRKVLKR